MSQQNLASDSIELAKRDICPVVGCGGNLDTGWECNKCGYDAKWLVDMPASPTNQ